MSERVTVIINDAVLKELRKIQGNIILKTSKPMSFSKVLNEALSRQLGVELS